MQLYNAAMQRGRQGNVLTEDQKRDAPMRQSRDAAEKEGGKGDRPRPVSTDVETTQPPADQKSGNG